MPACRLSRPPAPCRPAFPQAGIHGRGRCTSSSETSPGSRRAMPKSRILARPDESHTMLAVFRSRCRIPRLCACASPSAIWMPRRMTSCIGSPAGRTISDSGRPSTCSIAIHDSRPRRRRRPDTHSGGSALRRHAPRSAAATTTSASVVWSGWINFNATAMKARVWREIHRAHAAAADHGKHLVWPDALAGLELHGWEGDYSGVRKGAGSAEGCGGCGECGGVRGVRRGAGRCED